MPRPQRPALTKQENLIALLAHDPQTGRIIAGNVSGELFDGEYKLIATRLIGYWHEHGCPPGVHTIDLFGDIVDDISDARHAQAFRRILLDMQELAPRVNTDFVLRDLEAFTRGQLLADAILRGAEELGRGTDLAEVEEILSTVLRTRVLNFDPGIRLDGDLDPFLSWLQTRQAEFATGIGILDQRGIVPSRGAVMLLVGGKGRGKSWFLVNVGKHALMQQQRVLHISLENDANETRLRYYMALWGASRHQQSHNRNGVAGIEVEVPLLNRPADRSQQHLVLSIAGASNTEGDRGDRFPPRFHFEAADLASILRQRIDGSGLRLSDLIIKRFPNRTLSVEALAAYLDTLAQVERFLPDVLLLDYARLLKLPGNNAQDRRIGIGDNLEKLRALAIERDLALVTVDQLNRSGYAARKANSTHIGEDWSQVHTSDIVLVHNATDSELKHGLCRLWVEHARGQRDKFGVILTQNFNIGQFCLDSGLIPETYYQTMMPADEAE